jgi:hypothetical protein
LGSEGTDFIVMIDCRSQANSLLSEDEGALISR